MTNLLENKISISYRRDDFVSYMIIKIEDEEAIINYQTEMITNNKIPRLLQVDIRRKDNKACFYYNITSKIPLSQFLNRRKITKEELMAILVQITETMLAGMNFLLYNKCFILQEKYIYINPATNEISLLYLPVSYDTGVKMSLRNFVINLIVYSADIDDEDTSDNYIQKILNYVKCETFNIADFNKLLVRMCAEDVEKVRQEDEPLEENMKEINYDNLSFKHRQNLYRQEVVKNKISSFIIAGISQLIILAFLLLSKDFLKSLSGNIKTTYFAIGLILVAVDVIIFKNLLAKRKGEHTGIKHEHGDEHEYGCDYEYGNKYEDKCEDKSISNHQYNTELLAVSREEKPFLKCMRDGVEEEVLISNSDFLIGRLEGYVDYIVQNNAVGKVHAQIITREGKYYVKDLNSKNGTFINDIQVDSNTEHEIKNGDRITFANSDYEFKVCLNLEGV